MLTQRQTEIITGSLLGDGTLWTNFTDRLCKLQISQSKLDHKGTDKGQYILWFVKEFMNFGCSVRPKQYKAAGVLLNQEVSKDKTYDSYIFNTRCSDIWNELENKWYTSRADHSWYKRRKIIPSDIKLTPLSLCIWYMDDGSNYAKDANLTLETQGFTEQEVELLIDRLKIDLNIESNKKKSKKKEQFRIYVGRKSYFDFIETIKPHVEWNCFKYKLDTTAYNKLPNKGETAAQAKLNESQVKEIFDLYDQGWSNKLISQKFSLNNAAISMILSGQRWSHLGLKRDIVKKPRITNDQKAQIVKMALKGLNQNQIASEMKINQATVSRIISKALNKVNPVEVQECPA